MKTSAKSKEDIVIGNIDLRNKISAFRRIFNELAFLINCENQLMERRQYYRMYRCEEWKNHREAKLREIEATATDLVMFINTNDIAERVKAADYTSERMKLLRELLSKNYALHVLNYHKHKERVERLMAMVEANIAETNRLQESMGWGKKCLSH